MNCYASSNWKYYSQKKTIAGVNFDKYTFMISKHRSYLQGQ